MSNNLVQIGTKNVKVEEKEILEYEVIMERDRQIRKIYAFWAILAGFMVIATILKYIIYFSVGA